MLMHVSLAACTFLFGTTATGMSFLIYGVVSAALWWVVVAVVVAAPAIRAFIVRHAALSYYALVFVISWGGMLVLVGPGGIPGTEQQVRTLMPLALVVLFAGPSLSGILMTAIVHGRAGLRGLVSRLLRWRVGTRWYAIAILTGPLLVSAVLVPLSLVSPDFVPGLVTSDDKLALLMFGIAWGLVGGGFLEELGWTGFAVPTLRLRHGALTTALIVGLLWGVWHFLIAFWGSSSLSGGRSVGMFVAAFLVFYIAALPAYRVLMVWVYDRTQSLLVAMLMHASLSASTLILQPVATGAPALIWNLILAVALWVVVAAVGVANRAQLSRGSLQPHVA
jgi:membrane protease YdiL (CAAX protease family)